MASFAALALVLTGNAPWRAAQPVAATAVDDAVARLNAPHRATELTSETALRVRRAIAAGDDTTARQLSAAVLATSRLQTWRFYPFTDFIGAIADPTDPGFEASLSAWVQRDANNPLPLLVRAQYHYDRGWFRRGHGFSRSTRPADLAAFADDMRLGLADIDAALKLSDDNPYAYHLKLLILRGSGMSSNMQASFQAAIARYPGYYPLYDIALSALQPRWGGSTLAMYQFVDRYAGATDPYSPLRLLFVRLYDDLLSSASGACQEYAREGDRMAECVRLVMEKIITTGLEDRAASALRLYDHSDRHQFDVAIEPILLDMLNTAGGDVFSGAFLQLAATAMHSDPQLKEDHPGHNDYVIDKAVAASWYRKGFYDNALRKHQEALLDVQAAAFPGEAEQDLAVAGIYDDMAGTYNKLNQYADMIATEKAAISLGGRNVSDALVCYGYYMLKDDAAVTECTKIADADPANVQVLYWRGLAEERIGQTGAAVQDFTKVADSESDFRASAAIRLSMVHFDGNDIAGALEVLNRYTYLYNPDTTAPDNVAVGFNNRCYAYMQLNELKKALADCTASLKYGSLPDAYRKQQELIKRLGTDERGL